MAMCFAYCQSVLSPSSDRRSIDLIPFCFLPTRMIASTILPSETNTDSFFFTMQLQYELIKILIIVEINELSFRYFQKRF